MALTIYVCGPMSGLPEYNVPAFGAAAARLREKGWRVLSPVDIGQDAFGNNPDVPPAEYLRADVRELVMHCSAIALLPGWEASVGARCEVVVALTIGLDFYDAITCERIDKPRRVTVTGGYDVPRGAIDTLDGIVEETQDWQRATFPHATPLSVATHLLREAHELRDHPTDAEEIADVVILAIAAAGANGINLAGAVRAKLEKNKARTWGVPDADGVVEHVKEAVGT